MALTHMRASNSTAHRFPNRGNLSRHAVLLIGALAIVGPFLWMVTTSLKSMAHIFGSPYFIPQEFRWDNFATAFAAAPFLQYYVNTLTMTVGILIGHVVLDTMAAYAFARLRFPGRNVLFFAFIGTMMVPYFVTMIPAYVLVGRLGWIDSYAALIVPRLADVFGIVVIRQYLVTIPNDLEEAARLDGAGKLRILWSIMVPLAKPPIVTVAVFSILFAWNDFLWPLLVTNSDTMRTVQVGLAVFRSGHNIQWHLLMAGTITATAPTILLFLLAQRFFVKGVAVTGLK